MPINAAGAVIACGDKHNGVWGLPYLLHLTIRSDDQKTAALALIPGAAVAAGALADFRALVTNLPISRDETNRAEKMIRRYDALYRIWTGSI